MYSVGRIFSQVRSLNLRLPPEFYVKLASFRTSALAVWRFLLLGQDETTCTERQIASLRLCVLLRSIVPNVDPRSRYTRSCFWYCRTARSTIISAGAVLLRSVPERFALPMSMVRISLFR